MVYELLGGLSGGEALRWLKEVEEELKTAEILYRSARYNANRFPLNASRPYY
ncbi:MAG: hypothetical protein QXQ92_07715 [Candidatus Nezhaarchaeales archaeon]